MCKFENEDASPTDQPAKKTSLFAFTGYFKYAWSFLKQLLNFIPSNQIQDQPTNTQLASTIVQPSNQVNGPNQQTVRNKPRQKRIFRVQISEVHKKLIHEFLQRKNEKTKRVNFTVIDNKNGKQEEMTNKKQQIQNKEQQNRVQQNRAKQQKVSKQKKLLLKYCKNRPKYQRIQKKSAKYYVKESMNNKKYYPKLPKYAETHNQPIKQQILNESTIPIQNKLQMINQAINIINQEAQQIDQSIQQQQQIQYTPNVIQMLEQKIVKIEANIAKRNERLKLGYEQAKVNISKKQKRRVKNFNVSQVLDIIEKPVKPIVVQIQNKKANPTMLDLAIAAIKQTRVQKSQKQELNGKIQQQKIEQAMNADVLEGNFSFNANINNNTNLNQNTNFSINTNIINSNNTINNNNNSNSINSINTINSNSNVPAINQDVDIQQADLQQRTALPPKQNPYLKASASRITIDTVINNFSIANITSTPTHLFANVVPENLGTQPPAQLPPIAQQKQQFQFDSNLLPSNYKNLRSSSYFQSSSSQQHRNQDIHQVLQPKPQLQQHKQGGSSRKIINAQRKPRVEKPPRI